MRKSRLFCIILSGLIASILISCGNGKTLREAESLLETNPKAADSLLSAMPIPQSRRVRAWYAVLKTQAEYKQYKPINTDSLILSATEYYGTHRKSYRSAMAWYTQGCVYSELQNDITAIESFLQAKDLFPDTILRYYALTEKSIGSVLLKRNMLQEAFNMFERSKAVSELLNDSSLIVYSDFKQSMILLQNEEYDTACVLFHRLLDNPYISSFNRLELYLGISQIATFYEKDFYKSISLTDYCISSKSHRAAGFNQRGINYLFLNRLDSAIICFKESMSSQKDIYTEYSNYSFLAESYIRLNEPDSALHYFSLCDLAIDSIGLLLNHEEITSILLSHTNEKNRKEIVRMRYILYSSVIIASIIVLFLIILYFIQRDRNRKKYYIELSDQYRIRKIGLKPGSSESEILDYCLQKFYSTPSFDFLKEESCIITGNMRQSILHDLTVSFSEYYSFARINYPAFNTKYINFCILHYLNFSHQQVIEILCLSENNYRVSKSRIRKIIDSSNILYPK